MTRKFTVEFEISTSIAVELSEEDLEENLEIEELAIEKAKIIQFIPSELDINCITVKEIK